MFDMVIQKAWKVNKNFKGLAPSELVIHDYWGYGVKMTEVEAGKIPKLYVTAFVACC